MNAHSIIFFLGTLIAFTLPLNISAQTCRVNAGTCEKGCKSYIEVYEYDYVENKPEFPGGGQCMLNFINENRNYPEEAYKKGIEGRVSCSFVVNTDGSISNITVVKGVEESLNQEAMRVLSKMPDWTPGKINNKPVPVRVICCVPFRK